MFDKRAVVGLISISFIGSFAGKVLRYALNVVISRGFGVGALGVFAFGLVVMRMGSLVSRFGFDKSVQKFIPEYQAEEDPEKLFGVILFSLAIPLTLGIVIATGIYFLPSGISDGKLTLFALLIPLHAILMVGINITRGFKRTRYAVYGRELCHSGLSVLFAIIAAYIFNSFRAAIAGYFISLLLSNILVLYYVYNLADFTFGHSISIETSRIMTFSAPLALLYFAQHFVSWADILILTYFESSTEVGLYQAAFQTSVIVTFVLSAVNTVFPALLSELYANEKTEEIERMYRTVTKWLVGLSVLIYISIWINIDLIMAIFEIESTAAKQLFVILGLGQVAAIATGPSNYLLVMSENERLETLNVIAAALFNIFMNLLLVTHLGVIGAAIATMTTYGLLNASRVVEIYVRLDVKLFDKGFFKDLGVLLPSVLVFAIYQYRGIQSLYLDILATVVVGVCYVCSILYVGFSDEDRKLLQSVDDV